MKKNNKKYALKEMSKVKIIDRRSEKSIRGERDFLSKLHHPFIVNMVCAFQDYETLYLVMDLLTGGDLRYHLCRIQKFNEEETKFFISCVLLGLEYIHGNNIIHRDIKPENLVCDEKGYIRITDFGVAKIRKEDNSSETSGTPGYMAPEVLLGQNHSFPVDFFAIGIMGFEFMFGERPYIGRSRKEIKHLILRKQAKIEEEEIPNGWSYESVDFINKCLRRKHNKRLGYENGVNELKEHPWFTNYNWEKLYNKNIRAPFLPKKGGNYDKKYCEAIEKISDTTFERYQSYINQKNFGKIFVGYTFINYELIQNSLGIEANTRNTTNSKQSKFQSTTILTSNYNNNEKKKFYQINNNSKAVNALNNRNKEEENKDKDKDKEKIIQSIEKEKEKESSKFSNNCLPNKEKIEEKKIKLNEDDAISLNNKNNIFSTPKNKYKKKIILDKKEVGNIHFKIDEEGNNTNKENNNVINLASNNSINNNLNIFKNNIKKVASLNEKENIKLRSTSVDMSATNLKNNLSNNMNYIKQKNKELNMNFINNNFSSNKSNDKNDKLKYISGSLSNPNREKITYKLKNNTNNTGLTSSMMTKKNPGMKREISGIYNNNNNLHKNHNQNGHNSYLQLKKFNGEGKNEFPFYLPNLNKNANIINLYGFKRKNKLNLNQLKFKLNLNSGLKNDFINTNKNKFFLSPTNRKLKKSESTNALLKGAVNLSTNRINNNNINNYNNNYLSPHLKRNFSNFTNKDIRESNIRNLNSAKRKRYKDNIEGY